MRKSTIAIVTLSLALVASNAWWIYATAALVHRLHGVENMSWDLHDSRVAERTAMALLLQVAGRPVSRADVVASLEKAGVVVPKTETAQEQLHAGGVLFVFDHEGHLSEAKEPRHFRD